MRALIATGDDRLVRLEDVAPPVPTGGAVLVDVEAVSANRGELHRLREASSGWRPGWDFAGTVVYSTAEIPAGRRVYGMLTEGAWANRIVVPVDYLAELPDSVSTLDAAALPVAGLTAARILRLAGGPAGGLAGRRVMVAGAAGGVGRFAVQLARLLGATVHAHVSRPERVANLRELGAHAVWCAGEGPDEPMDVVLDSVGGKSLERAFTLVADRGVIVTFGNSAMRDSAFPVSSFYARQALLRGYHLLHDIAGAPPAADLAWLVDLVARGRLQVERGLTASWQEMPRVLRELGARTVSGKAVLTVG